MLMPKRVKYRKAHRGRRKGVATRGHRVSFGDYGLKALEPAWITSRQIEACRVAISRHMKRDGKSWIRIFPDKPVSKKPLETRMGKVMFEVGGVDRKTAHEALTIASHKLPIKTKIVQRPDLES